MDDNSTLTKLLAVITINASHREHRIVLPHDLSSLIKSFSNLSSFWHVGQSLGSFAMLMISLMNIILVIFFIHQLPTIKFVVLIGISNPFQMSNRFNHLKLE